MAFTLPACFSSSPLPVFGMLHILARKLSVKAGSLLFWPQRSKIQHPLQATRAYILSSNLSLQSRTAKPACVS